MTAFVRSPMLRPPFTPDDREFLDAVYSKLQRIGLEAGLVVDPAQGEVIYVGACIGEMHWRAARTLDGAVVELTNIDDDRGGFVGNQSVLTLRDAFATIVGRMHAALD